MVGPIGLLSTENRSKDQITPVGQGGVYSNRKGVQVGDPQKTPVFEASRYRKDPPFLR